MCVGVGCRGGGRDKAVGFRHPHIVQGEHKEQTLLHLYYEAGVTSVPEHKARDGKK